MCSLLGWDRGKHKHFIQGLEYHVLAIALLHEARLNNTSGLNVTSSGNVKLS